MPEANRHGAERDNKRRKKKPRNRKPWELGSEGEETSDGSSTEKVRLCCFVFLILILKNYKIQHKVKNNNLHNFINESFGKLIYIKCIL